MAQTTYILPTKLKKFKLITPIIIGDELLIILVRNFCVNL